MDYRIKAGVITFAIVFGAFVLSVLIMAFPHVFVWIVNVLGTLVVTGMIYYFVAQWLKEEE